MKEQIEWIKESVRLIFSEDIDQSKKKERFLYLQEVYSGFTDKQRNYVREIICGNFGLNDSIFVYSCLIDYMDVEEFKNEVLLCMMEEKSDIFTDCMLELQTVRYGQHLWELKKRLHRKNVENIICELDEGKLYSYIPVTKRNNKRIVIMTEQILSILHAPTQVVLNFAYVLQELLGYEVLLAAVPSNGDIPEDIWHNAFVMNVRGNIDNEFVKVEYKDTGFILYQTQMYKADYDTYKKFFDIIYEWNPLFVFNMGLINPIGDFAARFTTTAAMSMTTECPISEADILIRIGRNSDDIESIYIENLSENQKQLFLDEKIPIIVEESKERAYTYSELALPQKSFLIAVVGRRLDEEIDDEFVNVMKQIINKTDNAAFVIIGDYKNAENIQRMECMKGRIYYLGYQNHLMSVYKLLHLYINPKRLGGGFSSVMALKAGLPVITLTECDVAYNVGDAFAVKDYEEMINLTVKYTQDKQFYKEQKKYIEAVLERNTEENMCRYIKRLVDNIVEVMEENANDTI